MSATDTWSSREVWGTSFAAMSALAVALQRQRTGAMLQKPAHASAPAAACAHCGAVLEEQVAEAGSASGGGSRKRRNALATNEDALCAACTAESAAVATAGSVPQPEDTLYWEERLQRTRRYLPSLSLHVRCWWPKGQACARCGSAAAVRITRCTLPFDRGCVRQRALAAARPPAVRS